jgi:hypothetical protein
MTELIESNLRAELESMPIWVVSAFQKFIDGDDYEEHSVQYLLMYKLIKNHIPVNYSKQWTVQEFKWIFVEVALKCYQTLNY